MGSRRVLKGDRPLAWRDKGTDLQDPSPLDGQNLPCAFASTQWTEAMWDSNGLAALECCLNGPEFIGYGFIFEVGEFTGIHKYPVLRTRLKFQVGLLGIIEFLHRLAAFRAIDVPDLIKFCAHFRLATIDIFRTPLAFGLFGFILVKPKPTTAFALIQNKISGRSRVSLGTR